MMNILNIFIGGFGVSFLFDCIENVDGYYGLWDLYGEWYYVIVMLCEGKCEVENLWIKLLNVI